MITGLSHISLVVPDLDKAAARLSDLYGLKVGTAKVNEEQGVRLAYIELGNARIELMEPARPDSPVAKFLERHPDGGIHHLCLSVESVERIQDHMAAKGVNVLGDGGTRLNIDGERIAFVHPRDFLGALVELEEHNSQRR